MAYTSTDLIADIKRHGAVPLKQNRFTEEIMLSMADSEIADNIYPFILRARENFFEYDVDTTIDGTSPSYDIHSRAMGSVLSNVALVNGNRKKDLAQIDEDDLEDYDISPSGMESFYVKRNQIYLVPKNPTAWPTLRQTILLSHGRLVETTAAAQVTSLVNGTTLGFANGTIPTTWTTASVLDIIQAKPHFDTVSLDKGITSLSTTQIELSSAYSSRVAVGDWVALSGETPIMQLPVPFHDYLAMKVAISILRSLSDHKGADALQKDVEKKEPMLKGLIQPRVQKESKKLVNSTGILRRAWRS